MRYFMVLAKLWWFSGIQLGFHLSSWNLYWIYLGFIWDLIRCKLDVTNIPWKFSSKLVMSPDRWPFVPDMTYLWLQFRWTKCRINLSIVMVVPKLWWCYVVVATNNPNCTLKVVLPLYIWLAVLTILKNISSSMGRIIPYIMENHNF